MATAVDELARPRAGSTIVRQLAADVRWTFRPPWTWLSGVAANLVLAAAWWGVVPLLHHQHGDWGMIIGTYLASFVLADVTSTNVLGADSRRVSEALAHGVSLPRLLVVKNLTLLVVVALPLLVASASISLAEKPAVVLAVALPVVLFPVLVWLGIGNLLSVAFPEPAVSLRRRWSERRQWRRTVRWLAVLGLPYALSLAVDPLRVVPRDVIRWLRADHVATPEIGGVVVLVGLAFYVAGTLAGLAWHRRRGLALIPR